MTNPPDALQQLLTDWLDRHPENDVEVSPYEFWAENAIAPDAPATGDSDGDRLTNLEEFTYGTNPTRRVDCNYTQVAQGAWT